VVSEWQVKVICEVILIQSGPLARELPWEGPLLDRRLSANRGITLETGDIGAFLC
jgi:hypothetical protein